MNGKTERERTDNIEIYFPLSPKSKGRFEENVKIPKVHFHEEKLI